MTSLNTAFYHFAPLADLPTKKREWLQALEPIGLKGTIIIAPEGINGFLAGTPEAVGVALTFLRQVPELAGLMSKESESEGIPFRKLCIKIKKEIVTFRLPGFSPLEAHAPRISPEELASWYKNGEDFLTLDTRNEYEARLGTFSGAHVLAIDHFVEFADAAKELPEDWRKKPVVTFCTGGIRCEKAAPYLASLGFENVYQLDGGILNYFEKVGGDYWEGECFVFDDRIALSPDLAPTGARLCKHCQGPIPEAKTTCIHCGQ